jgi:hypothetical protein
LEGLTRSRAVDALRAAETSDRSAALGDHDFVTGGNAIKKGREMSLRLQCPNGNHQALLFN